MPHAPDLPVAILAVDIDAQTVHDSEPFVAVNLAIGTAPCDTPDLRVDDVLGVANRERTDA